MAMPHSPEGLMLGLEEVTRIMAPDNWYKLDYVDVAQGDGTQKTHSFEPPYKMEPGLGYCFWETIDGTPQLWQVEQRDDHGIYYVRECGRVQPSDLH